MPYIYLQNISLILEYHLQNYWNGYAFSYYQSSFSFNNIAGTFSFKIIIEVELRKNVFVNYLSDRDKLEI